jgi:hypothetical protein
MFSPDSFLFKKISRGTYGAMSIAGIRFLLVVTMLSYVVLLVTGVLGTAMTPDRRRRLLPCLVFGLIFLVHLVANASSRYRLPLMLLLIPYAGYALVHLREVPRLLGGRKWIVPVLILAWFAAVCLPYFYSDAVSLWEQGTYVNQWRP